MQRSLNVRFDIKKNPDKVTEKDGLFYSTWGRFIVVGPKPIGKQVYEAELLDWNPTLSGEFPCLNENLSQDHQVLRLWRKINKPRATSAAKLLNDTTIQTVEIGLTKEEIAAIKLGDVLMVRTGKNKRKTYIVRETSETHMFYLREQTDDPCFTESIYVFKTDRRLSLPIKPTVIEEKIHHEN